MLCRGAPTTVLLVFRAKLLLDAVGLAPLCVTAPMTVGLPPPTVMVPFVCTAARLGELGGADVTVVLDASSRLPPVRMAWAGAYGVNRYSALMSRCFTSAAPRRGDQPRV